MSVVEPNVLELLEHADSRYTLVVEASRRSRSLVEDPDQALVSAAGRKPLEVAVEEIERDLITYEHPQETAGEDA